MKRAIRLGLPLWIVAGGFALALAPAARSATVSSCPVDSIVLNGVSVVSNDAARDTTVGTAHGGYDLARGTVTSAVGFSDPGWATSSVATDDEYWVLGPPAGTAVDFTAEFQVSGSWNVYPG